ncbi:MAG: Glutamate synthase (NADPH) small chain [candidate division BRC1 bacterium ADurb.Bin183]|nr:MAG: Glutamate synthase (NADPH) small chain [candidate division BRC1 bacterium ADurb.Bin183]
MEEKNKNTVGAVAVVGGGVAGVQTALDLADSGFFVYIIEEKLSIGGVMAQLDKTFPTNDCSMCILAPKLVDTGRHHNIKILTNSEITAVEGEAGNFKVTVLKHPRYVDLSKCNGCGECVNVCPITRPNSYNENLSERKAIYREFAQAIPNAFAIEKKGCSPCKSACPIDTSAQGYVALIREGRYEEAYKLIRSVNPLPGICGRVCHHPCEEQCKRFEEDEPIAIASLKRFAVDWARRNGIVEPFKVNPEKKKNKKVAIIGSGPAGLAAAHDLALEGYDPVIYEAMPRAGGMLASGIPDYRLPPDVLDAEIKDILSMGVELKLNAPIGKSGLTLADLRKNHDAVFIGVGAQLGKALDIPGEDLEGYIHAVDFLRMVNLSQPVKIGKRVGVIGGGNAAIDASRTALRLGAEEVFILYRRTRKEMPANHQEIEDALEEGVKIEFLVAPVRIVGESGRVSGIECQRMELGEPDSSGRRRPVAVKGSEFIIPLDTVIPAISQSVDFGFTGGEPIKTNKWGTIETDACMRTNIEGVFAGGDAVSGPDTVITAIAAGKKAARFIHRFLSGEAMAPEPDEKRPKAEGEKDTPRELRVRMRALDSKERIKGFEQAELGFTEEEARREASRCLQCGICSECYACVDACKPGAIVHDMAEEYVNLDVGAIILAPGFDEFEPKVLEQYGYGKYPNVVTSIEFERILGATGPYEGHVKRPSDKKPPKKVAFLQCVGSRDSSCGRDYCSSVCCMYATKEAVIAREHSPGLETAIFFMDMRCYGKGFDRYYERAQSEYGVRFIRSRISGIEEDASTRNLILQYESEDGVLHSEEFDMAVLSVGLNAPKAAEKLSQITQISLNRYGFNDTKDFHPLETNREGIYVAGAFQGPKDVPETVMQASGAASRAGRLLASARGTRTTEKIYPPETDVSGESPRIGVFVCHCGINIGGVVDVPAVTRYAATLPYVVYAGENLFTCAQDTQESICNIVKEHNLNRVVVASCSPRTHEPLFQQTLREAGLNPYLFDMANIRDQCSWVHMKQPKEATEKAKDLVRMTVSKAAHLTPLERWKTPVTKAALVIGGGIAGMTAARALADQNFKVAIVEKSPELGGNMRHIYTILQNGDPQEFLTQTIAKVLADENIRVFTSARVKKIDGYIGNFKSAISLEDGSEEIFEHGVVIVATGALEKTPSEYHYGESDRILTQRELEKRLANRALGDAETFVMIQCVGSRDEERPYCSRVCCNEAIKNALHIKEQKPNAAVFILYRDMRTYSFQEEYYTAAREKGVVFVRYDPDRKPVVDVAEDGSVKVRALDLILQREISIHADMLILSMGTAPNPDNAELAQMLKVPLSEDGFFLEAHMKLRPVDFATDGIFLCGLAHAPKLIDEAIAQGEAAAARASVVLSHYEIETQGQVSRINVSLCQACGTCIEMCPYNAIDMDEAKGAAVVNPALCKGCGICASSCRCGAPDIGGFTNAEILAELSVI